jgi:hypothetical protein
MSLVSRYAPNDVDTDEKKQECFLNGLAASRVRILAFQTTGLCLPRAADLVSHNRLVLKWTCNAIYSTRLSVPLQERVGSAHRFHQADT